jgi:hypothetical protein
MAEIATSVIELAVGLVCLAAAAALTRAAGPRWLIAALVVAGAAASGHAVWSLVS